jgi:hypothetical protein
MVARLDTLPPEILFNILSFLEPTLNPTLESYPLNALAETNKQLNATVEEYARSLLKQHANIVPPKNARTFTCRKKWLHDICQFCKKNSQRKACFYPRLTCCKDCDRKQFPKMVYLSPARPETKTDCGHHTDNHTQTMTEATQTTHLSKLDLFTPSPLHPYLPPLASGSYAVNGGTATMLSSSDVLARRYHIYALLGDKVKDEKYMRVRPATHKRIIQHMGVEYGSGASRWFRTREVGQGEMKGGPKSMQSWEARREYAARGLEREWAAMGVSKNKGSAGELKLLGKRCVAGKGGMSKESECY